MWSRIRLSSIYICCKVKNWSKIWGFLKLKTGPSLKLKTGPSFFSLFFPQFYSVFWAFFETQIVPQCVKIVFLQNFGLSKMRFSKRKLHFLFFPFLCWKNRNRKKKKKENGKGQKCQKMVPKFSQKGVPSWGLIRSRGVVESLVHAWSLTIAVMSVLMIATVVVRCVVSCLSLMCILF